MYLNNNFDCPYCNYRSEYPMSPPPTFGGDSQNKEGMQENQPSSVPNGPPPSGVPHKNEGNVKSYLGMSPMSIEGGAIRPCKFHYIYIWLTNGSSFWAWLTQVGRKSASGFRWTGHRWVYFGTDLRKIDSFICQ
ncbi:MAG: hypothetical protein H7Y18_09470 [Clostridiaceae bacterium]|nr:hypothetical protein [Clostridiaceae bacterium]